MINYSTKAFACFIGGCLLVIASQAVVCAQQIEFPYWATVISDDAVVRSGPGTTLYATDRLRPGTEVEVYRHDPGGWMAIRPPEGSFSLVQRDEIELPENKFAKVTESEIVAWVGTRLNAVKKPLWQVKLREGEMLKVLGIVDRQQYGLSEAEPDWVQIAPPAGEFRWIAASAIKAIPSESASDTTAIQSIDEVDGLIDSGAGSDPESRTNTPGGVPKKPFDSWEPVQHPGEWNLETESTDTPPMEGFNTTSAALPAVGWKPARQTIANFVDERSGFLAENSPTNMYTNEWNNSQPTNANQIDANAGVRSDIFDATDSSGMTRSATSQTTTLIAPNFGNQTLQSLEMRLTQEMLKPQPAEWDLTKLAADAEQARNNATNQAELDLVDRIMAKIRSCREIKAGFRATGGGNNGGHVDLQTMRTGAPGSNPVAQTNLLYNYDAFGYLNESVRDGGTSPPAFVLQDENGQVTHLVAAPPGVNLRRYLGQRVGIIGNRGYHQQLQLDHVTAERVIVIDTLRR